MREKNGGKNNRIWLALCLVLLVVAVVAGGICAAGKLVERSADADREKLVAKVNDVPENETVSAFTEKPETEDAAESVRTWADYTLEEKYSAYLEVYGIEIPRKNLDFEDLRENTNEDIYAWLHVPGTKVDDPVVQHPTDDSYYLNYNLDGSKGYPGGIYTEATYNSKDFSDRMTVIYGHNMKNDSGFGSLHDFEDEDFFNENRYIFIYTEDDVLVYEIFAAYAASNNHIIAGHDWNDESWGQYLTDTLSMSGESDHSLDSYSFNANNRVLTLSTCIRNTPTQRYLVQGVLLNAEKGAE